jgi:hypothetical protein
LVRPGGAYKRAQTPVHGIGTPAAGIGPAATRRLLRAHGVDFDERYVFD